MEHVILLPIILAGATHAVEIKCTDIQNSSLCSVPPGGSVYIQVMTNASGHQVWCRKQLPSGPVNVFSVKKQKVAIDKALSNRAEFFISNGTFEITNVERNDSGHYIIDIYLQNGVFLRQVNVQLNVQEQPFPILIPVTTGVGALLLMLVAFISYCACKCQKKSSSRK